MSNITTQTIRVDLSTGKVIPTAYTHQNDTARTLVFDMYNGGLPYTMTGNTVKFAYKSPIVDGAYTVITGSGMASGTVSGNKVTVTLPSEYTAISGVGMLTMIITPTSGTVRPVNIRLVVQKSADGADEVAGASDFPTTIEGYVNDWLGDNNYFESIQKSLVNGDMPMVIISDQYVDPVNGSFKNYTGWSRTDYLVIPPDRKLTITNGGDATKYTAWYDSEKNYISGGIEGNFNIPNGTTTFTPPSNAVYFAISNTADGMDATSISFYLVENLEKAIHDKYLLGILSATTHKSHSANLWNQSNVMGYYYADHDDVLSDTRWSCSYPILIDPSKTYNWHWFASDSTANISGNQPVSVYVNMYTIDMDYIGRIRVGYESYNEYNYLYDVEWPSTCKYIILSCAHNLFSVEAMLVEGDDSYVFGAYVKYSSEEKPQPKSNANIKNISRLGMHKYGEGGLGNHFLPEQSLVAYENAYNHGFNVVLCDIVFTSDNVPVCIHDNTINRVGRNSDGSEISETIYVRNLTLAELNNYDFGIYVGDEFAGTKILTFEKMVHWCKLKGLSLYVEFKEATEAQTTIACNIVRNARMVDATSWVSFYTDSQLKNAVVWVRNNLPSARIGSMTNGDGITGTSGFMDFLSGLKTTANKVFAFNWRTETFTSDEALVLASSDIDYECGAFYTESQVTSYYQNNTGAFYLSGMECDSMIVASDILRKNANTVI